MLRGSKIAMLETLTTLQKYIKIHLFQLLFFEIKLMKII